MNVLYGSITDLMEIRLGRCKRKGGSHDGLPKTKDRIRSITLVDIGKLGNRAAGNRVQMFLVIYTLIILQTDLEEFVLDLFCRRKYWKTG